MTEGALTRLFVYGTLAPGASNAHVLAGLEGHWQPARVRGYCYPQGHRASFGYPALFLADACDAEAPMVEGLLFSSEDLHAFWPQLDVFEGEAYRRVVVPVELAGGHTVDAHVYEVVNVEKKNGGRNGTHQLG